MDIARLLPHAGLSVAAASLALNFFSSVFPVGFMVGMAVMMERVAALRPATAIGHGHWAGVVSAFGLATAALVMNSSVSPLLSTFRELITRRVDGYCTRRLMTASIASAPMAVLERSDVLDDLMAARTGLVETSTTPGGSGRGLVTLVGRYSFCLATVVMLGAVVSPMAAAVAFASAMAARGGQRSKSLEWQEVQRSFTPARRRLRYVEGLGASPALAKEVRALGILTWFTDRAKSEWQALYRPFWKERRRIFFAPYLVFNGLVLAGTVVVLVLLRDKAVGGHLSVLGLSLAVQAVMVPMNFGMFMPDVDVQTQYGMFAHDAIVRLERRFSEGAVRGGRAGEAGLGTAPAEGMPRSSVRFEGVEFSYPGSGHKVFDGLDLELEAGRSTAIVGVNGAGKTTLVKLLGKLYPPDAGRILVDGAGLQELDTPSWQRQIAVIFQDFVRYELDAASNIALGAPEHQADAGALARAVSWAGAEEVVAGLPEGLATPLSSRYEGGVDLSGGQWQRIALARALFAVGAGATLLVLDEPTAQLDVRAEVAFFYRFLQVTGGLTTVVISHRFSTVRRADRIVVLDGGRVVEDGTHDELLRPAAGTRRCSTSRPVGSRTRRAGAARPGAAR